MKPAFVVIDLQQRFADQMRHPELCEAVELVNYVAEQFRAANRPVVWVQDAEQGGAGTTGFGLLEQLDVHDADLRARKTAANAFRTLRVEGCDFLLLAGFKADGCVLSSAKGAEDRELAHAVLRGALLDTNPESVAFIERLLPIASHEVVSALLGLCG